MQRLDSIMMALELQAAEFFKLDLTQIDDSNTNQSEESFSTKKEVDRQMIKKSSRPHETHSETKFLNESSTINKKHNRKPSLSIIIKNNTNENRISNGSRNFNDDNKVSEKLISKKQTNDKPTKFQPNLSSTSNKSTKHVAKKNPGDLRSVNKQATGPIVKNSFHYEPSNLNKDVNNSLEPEQVIKKQPITQTKLPQPIYRKSPSSPQLSYSNSLPSISSSPSLSPSLVCPHLSLDDLLIGEENKMSTSGLASKAGSSGHRSPHTIGLCPRCRMSPPPNLHSPLSPVFAASQMRNNQPSVENILAHSVDHHSQRSSQARNDRKKSIELKAGNELMRSASHHDGFSIQAENLGGENQRRQSLLMLPTTTTTTTTNTTRLRDDSLDYFLNPDEVRMSQLSPVMRHSVGFIRTHSSESSRIIKVYKNGQPYDWPLRLCIGRNEFKSLNHLLDHINNRLIISYGARYLFHLDGQLVYSVNELKHGHSYLVSGTRHLDLLTSQIIKETEALHPQQATRRLSMAGAHQNELSSGLIIDKSLDARNRLPPIDLSTSSRIQPRNQQTNVRRQQDNMYSSHDLLRTNESGLPSIYGKLPENKPSRGQQSSTLEISQSNKYDTTVSTIRPKIVRETVDRGEQTQISNLYPKSISNPSLVSSRVESQINKTPHVSSTRDMPGDNQASVPNTRAYTRKVAKLTNGSQQQQQPVVEITRASRGSLDQLEARNDNESDAQDHYAKKLTNQSSSLRARQQERKPVNLVRAKSDYTDGMSIGQKKKNVTFKDTGRGSSPAVDLTPVTLSLSNLDDLTKEEDKIELSSMEMRDIGIQVSDSIEGFLIDLPIALPGRLEDEETGNSPRRKHDYLRRGSGQLLRSARLRQQKQQQSKSNLPLASQKSTSPRRPKAKRRQIVTITERQLSNDELVVLRDLDQGDHHRESPPAAKDLASVSELSIGGGSLGGATSDKSDKDHLSEVSLYLDETIVPCPPEDSKPPEVPSTNAATDLKQQMNANQQRRDSNRSKSSKHSKQKPEVPGQEQKQAAWQTLEGNSTPTERPVSQSAANETVHARITTPTPSISTTGGDTTSLSISYETTYHFIQRQQQMSSGGPSTGSGESFPALAELPDKDRVAVMGQLCAGSEQPKSNFKLIWINGFAINNHHHKSSMVNHPTPNADLTPAQRPTSRTSLSAADAHLSGFNGDQDKNVNPFYPSERYHNWLQHSLKHDELIYPVGRFIILWCRWTNEQRYYSGHSSNICALSLGPDETDLASSAQICEPKENIPSSIHIWSITKLQLLHKIDYSSTHVGRFPTKPTLQSGDPANAPDDECKIYSLQLMIGQRPGSLELMVGSTNQKRLWVNHYDFCPESGEVGDIQQYKEQEDGNQITAKFKTFAECKAYKAIQTTDQATSKQQVPLLIKSARITSRGFGVTPSTDRQGRRKSSISSLDQMMLTNMADKKEQNKILLYSLGRRLFHVWLVVDLNPAQQQSSARLILRPLQCKDRSAIFVNAISKCTCWLPWTSNQLLVGDSSGNVTMIDVSLKQQEVGSTTTTTSAAANTRISDLNKSPKSTSSANKTTTKYFIERAFVIISLIPTNSFSQLSAEQQTKSGSEALTTSHIKETVQITCMTRISNSMFLTGDSNCRIQAWKMIKITSDATDHDQNQQSNPWDALRIGRDLKLPEDFGCACSIVLARYSRSLAQVDFYVASHTNSILYATIDLKSPETGNGDESEKGVKQSQKQQHKASSLSIVYDGHEQSVISLVPDIAISAKPQKKGNSDTTDSDEPFYFTCSLDCKICKWQGKSLIWKSVLPSTCASMALHPTGFVLAVGSGDGTIYVLDKISGLLISYFPLTPVCINCLAYSRDGALLAAGCANGSIFILPVLDRGLKYNKVSIFQSPYPVLSVQFSMDSRYILTSVTHGLYQELILWDLPNFRYMRNEVTLAADKIHWYDSICSGSEDVRAIWENANMASACQHLVQSKPAKLIIRRHSVAGALYTNPSQSIVNLSCHRLIKKPDEVNGEQGAHNSSQDDLVIASDIRGYVRLFKYPCYDIEQGFYQIRLGSSPVNCCRFLASNNATNTASNQQLFVTTSVDGAISLWELDFKQYDVNKMKTV